MAEFDSRAPRQRGIRRANPDMPWERHAHRQETARLAA